MIEFNRLLRSRSGLTLLELMATLTIISILATGILPLSQVAYRRSKEFELRAALRTIRTALDQYYELYRDGEIKLSNDATGYPKTLEILVDGFTLKDGKTLKKLLRRIPKDPFSEDDTWGLRAYADDADSRVWGGQDVYDIYSTSDEIGLDGTPYNTW